MRIFEIKNMKIQTSTDLTQKALIIRLADTTDIGSETGFTFTVYVSTTSTAIATYVFSESEVAYFKENKIVCVPTLTVFTTMPDDSYLYCKLDGGSVVGEWDSVVFTLKAKGQFYNAVGFVDVYDPDYNVSTKLHVAKILLDGMEAMQYLDYPMQKKVDFDVRLNQLQTLLSV